MSFNHLLEEARQAHERYAAHRASCEDPGCESCKDFRCVKCKTKSEALSSFHRMCPTCERTRRHRELAKSIPLAFDAASLDAAWLQKLVTPAFVEEARKSLGDLRCTFAGPAGSGKTSLAIAMMRAAIAICNVDRDSFLYASAHELAKARSTSRLGEEPEVVERALRCGLLVVDELGGEDERYGSAVSEIIYERHAWQRATWITTGVNSERLGQRYGGGIVRRISEGATIFKMGEKVSRPGVKP